MKNHDDRYNNGNKYEIDDDNAASNSGSRGPILNPITTPWSHGGVSGSDDDGATAVTPYVSTCWNISTI